MQRSTAAAQAISQCFAILKMDTNPTRFQWMQQHLEADFVCLRRRREWLGRAGCGMYLAGRAWDDLPQSVRNKLGEVEA